MTPCRARAILLDIEGTVAPILFVHDVLFPYARRHLEAFALAHWDEPEVRHACNLVARDAQADDFQAWCRGMTRDQARQRLTDEAHRLMDADLKKTGLKELQGLIWREGYERGELRSPIYADVPPALAVWQQADIDVRVYSSGSIEVQKQFFAHTDHGDLLPYFRGHYDTTIGAKKEAASYERIVADVGVAPSQMLFLSDVAAELDAGRAAGLLTGLVVRPGNAAAPPGHGHPLVEDFSLVEGTYGWKKCCQ